MTYLVLHLIALGFAVEYIERRIDKARHQKDPTDRGDDHV